MNSLNYLKKSTNSKQPGFIYLHHFGTGNQELVFNTHKQAKQFADVENCTYTGVKK